MAKASTDDRWDYFQRNPEHNPLKAVNHWEGLAEGHVEWDTDSYRAPDNTVIHIAIPIITCNQFHYVKDDDMYRFRRASNNSRMAYDSVHEALHAWVVNQGDTLLDFAVCYGRDSQGRHIAWPTSYVSRLEHRHIQSCQGQGRNVRDAKYRAAENLFSNGHCMIRLSR